MIPPPKKLKGRNYHENPVHNIKSGDLVKMRYMVFWMKKSGNQRVPYTDVPMLVLETAYNAIKVITPDGSIKTDLAEYYEVVNENA